jgi:thiol-disulfide isomerase/thioredoxin
MLLNNSFKISWIVLNMTLWLNNPVAYLQDNDFDTNGHLINPKIPKDVPVVIGIFGNFCGYCTKAKPAFQEFANKTQGKVFCVTIQGDGEVEGEKALAKRIKQIDPSFQGFPSYVLYKNGKYVRSGDTRSVSELTDFANS